MEELVDLIRDLVENRDYSRLNEIYEHLGKQEHVMEELSEQDVRERIANIIIEFDETTENAEESIYELLAGNPQVLNFLQNDSITRLCLNEVYYENDIATIIKCFVSDEEKISLLENIEDEELIASIIESMKSKENKIKAIKSIDEDKIVIYDVIREMHSDDASMLEILDAFDDEDDRAFIIERITNDDIKIQLLNDIKDSYGKASIISTLKDDDKKIQLLNLLGVDDSDIDIILKSITDENKIIEYIKTIDNEKTKAIAIQNLKSDELKIELLKEIQDENNKLSIIKTLQDDMKKIVQLENFSSENAKLQIIQTLSNEEQKIEQLKTLTTESAKLEIVKRLRNVKLKIQQLDKFESDEAKDEILKGIRDQRLLLNYILQLQDDAQKIALSKYIYSGDARLQIILSLDSEEKKVEALKQIKIDMDSMEAIKMLEKMVSEFESDENKMEIIDKCKWIDMVDKTYLILMIQDEDKRMSYLDKIRSVLLKSKIIISLQDDDKKYSEIKRILENQKDPRKKEIRTMTLRNSIEIGEMILSLQSEDKRIELLESVEDIGTKVEIIKKGVHDDDKKINLLQQFTEEEAKVSIIKSIEDENKRISCLEFINGEINKALIIKTINEQQRVLEVISNNINDCSMRRRMRMMYGSLNTETIKNNIKQIIINEVGDCENIEQKIKDLEDMFSRNGEVYNTIRFELLDDKYRTIFTKEQIEILACYPRSQKLLINLGHNEKKLKLIERCLYNQNENNNDNWNIQLERILEQISTGQYDELIENLDFDNNENIKKLNNILQFNNIFNIRNLFDLENYQQIKMQACDAIVNGNEEIINQFPKISKLSTTEQFKLAVLEKLYGQDLQSAKILVEKFGTDIDSLSDEELEVKFVKSLKTILETDNLELLRELYNIDITLEQDKVNPILMEKGLKSLYGKQFNNGLYQSKKGTEVVKAGTDFKMIITSIAAFYENAPDNFEKDWNRNSLASQGFCCSYITNDMLVTAPIPHLCYGFNGMGEDSLMLSGPYDIYSDASKLNASSRRAEAYYTPEKQIDNTQRYNEMVFKRFQNGERKQPDYIVVFKEDGRIENLEKAKEAARHWREAGRELPIVVIDKNRCALENKNRINQMISECKSGEDLQKIIQKVKNNSKWNPQEFADFDEKIKELRYRFPTYLKSRHIGITNNDQDIKQALIQRILEQQQLIATQKAEIEILNGQKEL